MNLREYLVNRFGAVVDSTEIEHMDHLITISIEAEDAESDVGEPVKSRKLKFSIYRVIVFQITLEQIPRSNEYENLDYLAWGRAYVMEGNLNKAIDRYVHHGGYPTELLPEMAL